MRLGMSRDAKKNLDYVLTMVLGWGLPPIATFIDMIGVPR